MLIRAALKVRAHAHCVGNNPGDRDVDKPQRARGVINAWKQVAETFLKMHA